MDFVIGVELFFEVLLQGSINNILILKNSVLCRIHSQTGISDKQLIGAIKKF